jgi:hypothetical protein
MYKFIKKHKLIITCILAVYVIFMLRYFKTKYSFAHPLSDFSDAYFKHPVGQTKKVQSQICRFGHDASFVLGGFLILKELLHNNKYISTDFYTGISRLCFVTVFVFSLMNFNAVIYLIPFFIVESVFIF